MRRRASPSPTALGQSLFSQIIDILSSHHTLMVGGPQYNARRNKMQGIPKVPQLAGSWCLVASSLSANVEASKKT